MAKTLTNRTPVGRQSVTTFDDKQRVTQLAFPGLLPIQYTYNGHGQVSEITQGERTYALAYNDQGYLASLTDPLGHSIRFAYDPAGRVTRQMLADGREIQYSYDADGNLTTLTPPGRPPHRFTYNPLGQEIEYTAPAVGSEVTHSLYRYGNKRELVQRQRPDGTMFDFGYNAAGQMTSVQLPRGDIALAYNAKTGQLEAITEPGGSKIEYTYKDNLLTKTTWSGPLTGRVERTYDRHFNLTSRSVNEAHVVKFQYDHDGLLTAVGPLALYLDPQNALLTGTSLGDVTDAHKYNGYGEEIEYRAAYQDKALLTLQYTRDPIGRIAKQTETIDGRTHTYTYHYDASRRLTAVEKDGHLLARYEYDANGNRLKRTGPAGKVTGNYDAQDRLLQYDNTRYTYTAAGDLQATSTAERSWLIFSRQRTTAYDYDALGNLRSVNLPDGTQTEYLIDGDNRRIGKKVNGSLTQGFLYKDSLKPIAELDGTGTVVARFVYGTRSHVPDYLIKHGVTYRVLADYRGSPRLVVNVENGEIVQRLDYDEFGSILVDTNPGFQPFGFAGGLYDPHTGLLRFGARDYDATTGRWTTQDPIRFGGRSPNLYEYTYNDPINYIDPSGLLWDLVDIGSFGWSLYDFIKCPSLGTVVGLALDTLGLLPLVPALGTLQRIDDLYDDLRWADEAFDARRGFSTNGYTPGLCFTAGTEIATAEGEKAIEDIEVGDLVWAYDEQTGWTKFQRVVRTFTRIAPLLVVLSVGGEFIETTPEHPFWVIGKGWVEAYNLAVGDRLWTLHGDHLAIDGIAYREGSLPVYNFEVEGFHTYFVSQEQILVHNSCMIGGGTGGGLFERAGIQVTEHFLTRLNQSTEDWYGMLR